MFLLLVGIVGFHGCGRVSDEQLAQAVETAMKRSTLRHKGEIRDDLMREADRVAMLDLVRLNKAEQVYDTQVFFEMAGGGFHPMGYGFWFKIKRDFPSYEIVDIRESNSLFHKYETVIKYNYDVVQTHRFASAYEGAKEKATKDFNFQPIGKEGSWEFLYRFDADFELVSEKGEFVRAGGYQAPDYSSGTPAPVARTTKLKTRKGRMSRSLARPRKKQKGSTTPSKNPPAAKRNADEGVS
jgi:hypothetical protein